MMQEIHVTVKVRTEQDVEEPVEEFAAKIAKLVHGAMELDARFCPGVDVVRIEEEAAIHASEPLPAMDLANAANVAKLYDSLLALMGQYPARADRVVALGEVMASLAIEAAGTLEAPNAVEEIATIAHWYVRRFPVEIPPAVTHVPHIASQSRPAGRSEK